MHILAWRMKWGVGLLGNMFSEKKQREREREREGGRERERERERLCVYMHIHTPHNILHALLMLS
jgi:hypothetical protein